MEKQRIINRLIDLKCYRLRDRQLWELDELELTVLLIVTTIKQLKGINTMRFEIKCLCGMNILASLVEKEFENEGPVTSVLPIIATEDNGIGGIMVSAEEKAIHVKCTNCNKTARFLLEVPLEMINQEGTAEMDWSKVSFVGQEGN
ncbi:TPA: hypothetical protein ROY06_005424 [Bacillus cereus]|nr:hypothetical protein [Bacillus cereus]